MNGGFSVGMEDVCAGDKLLQKRASVLEEG